jgi:hypothetical protein
MGFKIIYTSTTHKVLTYYRFLENVFVLLHLQDSNQYSSIGAFTLHVMLMLNENLGGILGGIHTLC